MDPSGRYGSIITLFREHSHDIVMHAISWAKQFGDKHEGGDVVSGTPAACSASSRPSTRRWRTPTG